MSTNQPSSSMKSVPSKAGELYGPNVLYLESADVNSDGSLVVKNLNNGNKLIIVMFQATWCGHCVRFKPSYSKLSKFLNKDNINFPTCAIESENIDKHLGQLLNFRGFPTIKYIDQNGKILNDYNGDRDVEAMLGDICKVYHKCYSAN